MIIYADPYGSIKIKFPVLIRNTDQCRSMSVILKYFVNVILNTYPCQHFWVLIFYHTWDNLKFWHGVLFLSTKERWFTGIPPIDRVSSLWKNHGNLEDEKYFFQTWKNHGIWKKPPKPGKIMEFGKLNLDKSWNFVSNLKLRESNFCALRAHFKYP